MKKVVSNNFKSLNGSIEIPADKSISHRAVMFASLANGISHINNFSSGEDPHSTLNIFKQLGVEFEFKSEHNLIVKSNSNLIAPTSPLYCGNSGTTMRLLSGILSRQNFSSILSGDESLSSRPMKRIIEPLTLMGAKIEANDNKAPLKITGQNLHSITYTSKIASAQVKSCILLAGLGLDEKTTVIEPFTSRNHTELMLKAMGANLEVDNNSVSIKKSELQPIEINICGDISSAAYFMVAGLIIPNSKITLKNVGLNPTRTGIIDVIKLMGGSIATFNEHYECGELVGDITVESSELLGCEICGNMIPRLIDEIPIIAVMATQAKGTTKIFDAQDLRNKESDRIATVVQELKKLGADIQETPDGMIIQGGKSLNGNCEINTHNDHRIAMSLYVAGLICKKEICINDFEWVNISFPNFEELFEILKK